jgi:hypothetical protein
MVRDTRRVVSIPPAVLDAPTRVHTHHGDQVIRENPASRGTEASAEVLVGPKKKKKKKNSRGEHRVTHL